MTLAELETLRAAVPADDALPASASQADLTVVRSRRALLDRRLMQAREAAGTLATLGSTDAYAAWLAFLYAARSTLDGELLAMPPRIRNETELAQYQRLTFSIRVIDFGFAANLLPAPIVSLASTRVGELMAAAGYDTEGGLHGPNGWRGSIKETEARIKTLTKQRTDAQAALDAALMDDAEREQQEAEAKKFRDALNSMDLRGPNLRVVDAHNEDVDEKTLTPLQRDALSRARASFSASATG